MIFKVLDINEKYKFNINDAQEAIHTEVLNGEDVLDLVIPGHYNIEKKDRIVFKDRQGNWKEFIVSEIITEHSDEGLITTLYCESSFYELYGDFIEDKKPRDVTADMALLSVLESTRWEVGIVDDLGINSANFYRQSVKEAVQKIAEVWGGEIRIRIEVSGNKIVHRYIDLLTRRGNDLGKRYEYTKDIQSIRKTVQADDVITALYGFGKGEEIDETGGYGRRIDFSEVEWSIENGDPMDKPLGQKWIGLDEVKERWGRPKSDGTKAHVFGKVEFDDIEDPEELLKLTWEKYQKRCEPLISYEGKVIDLKAVDGREHEGVGLGDVVTVIDKEFNPELRIKARVIQYTADLLDPSNDEVVLGNFIKDITDETIKNEKAISNFRDKQGVWDRSNIISPDLKIPANYLNDLIDKLNSDLNSNGGYVYLTGDGQGLITYDKPIEQDPTKAIQITGGAFRIANSKLPNGEWNWRTFGTGDGFVADLITAGKLKGGKVTFDLTNGTLLIGNNTEDYNLYFDGNNLSVKLSNNKSIETALTELETGLQDYTNQAIDNIQVGGRNLFHHPDINGEEEYELPVYKGVGSFKQFTNCLTFDPSETVGEKYTISFWAKSPNGKTPLSIYNSNSNPKYFYIPPTTLTNSLSDEWQFFKITIINEEYKGSSTPSMDPNLWRRIEIYASAKTGVLVKKIKVEKGDKATDWTPAPEDVQEELDQTAKTETVNELLNNITSQYDQALNNATENILNEVDNRIEEKSVILRQEIISEFELTAEQLQISFTELQEILDGNNSLINSLTTYFNFSTDGFTIGKSDSPFKINLTNEQMTFLENEAPVAWINAQRLYITNAEVTNNLILGNHLWEKYNNQLTIVRYLG